MFNEINYASFFTINITDSCSIQNIIASNRIFRASLLAKCYFSITRYVEYESIYKKRKSSKSGEQELIKKIQKAISENSIKVCDITIDDLNDRLIADNRKRLGMGEISSIAFAKRTGLGFLTDDKPAKKFALKSLEASKVQSSIHLVGWLFYFRHLVDTDIDLIIREHTYHNRHFGEHYRKAYEKAMQYRLTSPPRSET
ncbi:MAG: hypothetical protein PHV30_07675 [Candidatus Margulisbacteria bacterium]|nr:hypothetical protein [Candidatus Margulisiibacteriota bacterium]